MLIKIARTTVELGIFTDCIGGTLYVDTPKRCLWVEIGAHNYGRFSREPDPHRDGSGDIYWWRLHVAYDLPRAKRETARRAQEWRDATDAELAKLDRQAVSTE